MELLSSLASLSLLHGQNTLALTLRQGGSSLQCPKKPPSCQSKMAFFPVMGVTLHVTEGYGNTHVQ